MRKLTTPAFIQMHSFSSTWKPITRRERVDFFCSFVLMDLTVDIWIPPLAADINRRRRLLAYSSNIDCKPGATRESRQKNL